MEPRQSVYFGAPLGSLAAIVILTAALGGTSALAKPASSQQAEIKFVATQMDVAVEGEFKKFSADVDFDPTNPAIGKINVVIDVATVDTGSSDANELLKGKDFFDAVHFPHATFTSTSIKAAEAGKFLANGQFTLKGQTRPLIIPFKAHEEGARLWFEGSVPLSRLAYKVGQGEWADTGTLADQVKIRFKFFVPR